MNALKITVSTLAVIILTACSTLSSAPDEKEEVVESKSFDYKAPPSKVRALDVPPDLTAYAEDDRYGIPGGTETGTSYSEFTQGGARRKASSVLPPAKNVRLEQKDTLRWLVVNDKAENVWPVVRAFWLENGLTIKIENPQAGVIETEWAENRAKVPMDGVRKLLGSVFDGLFSSGERDQYHTRLQRSKDGNSTEIYISHYGMQEFIEKDETGYRWLPRPRDPELEATMLQLLMSKLGGGSGVLDSKQKVVIPSVVDGAVSPKLNKLADGSQSILLNELFDKSWRRVGLALERAGIMLADRDRSKGVYFLSAGKEDAKKMLGLDNVERIQVKVREIGAGCEVVVINGAGISNAETQKIVDTLYKTLGLP